MYNDIQELERAVSERQNSRRSERGSPELLDLACILAKRKRLLSGALLAGLTLGAAGAFFISDKYEATALIMAPQQQQSILTSLVGGAAGMANLSSKEFGFRNPADLYVGILGGNTIADAIIKKFDLRKVYRKETVEETRKKLVDRTTLEARKDTLIRITVEDTDAKRAAEMANAYVELLQVHNGRLALSEAAQRRQFFESQIDAEKKALAAAEAGMRATQERTGMLEISGQVEASIRSVAQIRAEISGREVLLQRLRAGATEQNPEVIRLQSELNEMRKQLHEFQSSGSRAAGNPLLPTAAVPRASLDYIRSLRDLKYHEALFEMLSKQYEAARIDEIKQAPVLQIVDRATVPDKRSGPPRTIIIVLAALGCSMLAVLYSLLAHSVSEMKADPVREGKIAVLRQALAGGRTR